MSRALPAARAVVATVLRLFVSDWIFTAAAMAVLVVSWAVTRWAPVAAVGYGMAVALSALMILDLTLRGRRHRRVKPAGVPQPRGAGVGGEPDALTRSGDRADAPSTGRDPLSPWSTSTATSLRSTGRHIQP